MKKDKVKLYIAIVISLIYVAAGIITLNDYGISWDEPTHFKRGQAYLQYFLTGKKTYEGIKPYDLEEARKNPAYHARSFFQNDSQNGSYYLREDGGHPPLNGIIASGFNLLFYQMIPFFGDVESYHLFEVFISGIAVGTVFIFGWMAVSFWAGLFSAIFLAAYPLFWAESHFNIKDPIETSFFTLTVFGLWLAFRNKSYKWVFAASGFAGFALSTKFNILFLPLITTPWLVLNYFNKRSALFKIFKNKKFLISLISFPIIMFLIFFISWPYLWHNTIGRTLSVISYYKEIGTEADIMKEIVSEKINLYALKWIIASTPLVTLLFGSLGIIFMKRWIGKKDNFIILWLLWLVVPILRVSFPGTSIYGGIRQIMEYIPALALIAGTGAEFVRILLSEKINFLKLKKYNLVSFVFLVLIIIASIIPLMKTHPNENVYFNTLFGGLPRLKDSGFPAAGNSFGNAYKQGLDWVINNASEGSQLALIQGTSLNVPLYKVPPKIRFSNSYFSGIERKGEYLMEVTYNAEVRVYFYDWEYVEKFLRPVHEVKVDGVPILKIWKNDLDHTRPEYQLHEIQYDGNLLLKTDESTLEISLPEEVTLSRMIVKYKSDSNCRVVKDGFVESSTDNKKWVKERDPLSVSQMPTIKPVSDGIITYFFAARKLKELRMILDDGSCALLNPQVSLVILR